MDWTSEWWRALVGYEWGLFFRSPGFGGVAVLGGALIALRGVGRTVGTQNQANAITRESALKEQWWARARWALDLVLSDHAPDRDVGFSVLLALAVSEYADQHEGDVVEAALDAALVNFFDDGDVEPGSAPAGEADLQHERGGES